MKYEYKLYDAMGSYNGTVYTRKEALAWRDRNPDYNYFRKYEIFCAECGRFGSKSEDYKIIEHNGKFVHNCCAVGE